MKSDLIGYMYRIHDDGYLHVRSESRRGRRGVNRCRDLDRRGGKWIVGGVPDDIGPWRPRKANRYGFEQISMGQVERRWRYRNFGVHFGEAGDCVVCTYV